MPCYRCGTRQEDPERGSSPWRRGVRADRQVLICPGCQVTVDWANDLDQCVSCGSVHLVRRLGEVECRDCGAVAASGVAPVSAAADAGPGHTGARLGSVAVPPGLDAPDVPGVLDVSDIAGVPAGAEVWPGPGTRPGLDDPHDLDVPPGLAEEVEDALARVLGRPARS